MIGRVLQTQGIATPSTSRIVVPDLLVALRERMTPAVVLPGEDALLAVEITSKSGAETDRGAKHEAYAQAGIPLYLLIDRFAPRWPTVTLFSEPDGDAYRESHAVPFGKPIELPSPFDVTLETEDFPR
ncbi:Uma2 family endonuclease [Saccharopolyspora sp. NPDC002578]